MGRWSAQAGDDDKLSDRDQSFSKKKAIKIDFQHICDDA